MLTNKTEFLFTNRRYKKSILCKMFGHKLDIEKGNLVFNGTTGNVSYMIFCDRCATEFNKNHMTQSPDDIAIDGEMWDFSPKKIKIKIKEFSE